MIVSLLLIICLFPMWEEVSTAPIQKNCEIKKTDVIFLLDSSSSIEESDYKKMLEFVSAFVDDTPTIGQKGTQVGIYTFATGFRNIIKLGRYQEKAALKSAIISINQTGGMTKTNLALDDILKNGFDPRADARPDAQRAVVVITDGKSEDTQKTKEAAAALHRENIFTMAIGVGKLVDKKELEVIATTGENAFTVKNFQALKTIEEQVNSVICVNKNISEVCKTVLTDVIFALDASSSIKPKDFNLQLKFVSKFIKDMKIIGKKGTQVSVYKFAEISSLIFPLGLYQDKEAMIHAVEHISQLNGFTNTHLVLQDILRDGFSEAFGARPDVQRVVIVITDGQSLNQKETIEAAESLHKLNIHTFSIGVGKHVDAAELEKIASSKENTYSVIKFGELKGLEKSINKVVCQKPTCSIIPVDLVFVLDSSSSLKKDDFQKEIDFVSNFVKDSTIGPDHIQIALLIYADNSNFLIKLNDFKDKDQLLLKLRNIKRDHGFTNTEKALEDVRNQAFSSQNGGRGSSVKQVVIVITDGVSIKPNATQAAAEALHSLNVEVFAVGVGKEVDVVELHHIASNVNNVITVTDFPNLKKIEKTIIKTVCTVEEKKKNSSIIVCTEQPKDVIFVLDSSDSVKNNDFQMYISFLSNFVTHAKIGPQNIQIGLLLYATESKSLLHLNDLYDKEQLKQRIKGIKRIHGFTNTDKALQDVITGGFTPKNGGRSKKADQIVIVITDGESMKPKDTKIAADTLKTMNVEIFAVGVGNVNVVELHSISSDDNHVYTVPDFANLLSIEQKLFKQVCSKKTISDKGGEDKCDKEGGNKDGKDKDGGNKDGGNKDGKDKDGGNKDGGNKDGKDKDGGNKDGKDKDGKDKDGGNKDGKDKDGGNKDGKDKDGKDKDGGNKDGKDKDGGNKDGKDKDGGNKDGNDRTTTPSTIQCDKVMADVVFLFDTSYSINDDLIQKEKTILSKFIASQTIGPQNVQVALITFSDKASQLFSLSEHTTQDSLQQVITGFHWSQKNGSTNTAAALKLAKSTSFQANNGARRTSHKVVIVITDGTSDDLFETHNAAKDLRTNGVNIFSVGIGFTDTFELRMISGTASNVFRTPDGSEVEGISNKLFDGKCGPVKA